MARGFLSDGGSRRERESEDVTVDLDLRASTEKAFGFRDPFKHHDVKGNSGGRREELIWVPRSIRGIELPWEGPSRGSGKLTAPQWLLKKKGLV